jgi:hypothetical protein
MQGISANIGVESRTGLRRESAAWTRRAGASALRLPIARARSKTSTSKPRSIGTRERGSRFFPMEAGIATPRKGAGAFAFTFAGFSTESVPKLALLRTGQLHYRQGAGFTMLWTRAILPAVHILLEPSAGEAFHGTLRRRTG